MIFKPDQLDTEHAEITTLTQESAALWDKLAAASDHPDPVNSSSSWQLMAHDCLSGYQPQILMMQTSDSQVMFTMRQQSNKLLLLPLEAHWAFGCPILGPDAVTMLEDVFDHLRAVGVTVPIEIEVTGLDPEGAHARQIDQTFDLVWTEEQDAQAMASLEGGIDGWMSRRSPNMRRNLRKAAKKAALNDITFERCSPETSEAAAVLYDRMIEIEKRSWKGMLYEGLLALPIFYEALLHAYVRRKMARVVIAKQGRRDIGFCYGGMLQGIYRGQQCSFDSAFGQYNIGNLLHYETAKWLAQDGAFLHHFGPIQELTPRKDQFCETIRMSVIKIIRSE